METMDLIIKKGVFTDWKDLLQNVLSNEESAKYMLWNPIYDEEHARDDIKKTIEFQRIQDAWLVYEKKAIRQLAGQVLQRLRKEFGKIVEL